MIKMKKKRPIEKQWENGAGLGERGPLQTPDSWQNRQEEKLRCLTPFAASGRGRHRHNQAAGVWAAGWRTSSGRDGKEWRLFFLLFLSYVICKIGLFVCLFTYLPISKTTKIYFRVSSHQWAQEYNVERYIHRPLTSPSPPPPTLPRPCRPHPRPK